MKEISKNIKKNSNVYLDHFLTEDGQIVLIQVCQNKKSKRRESEQINEPPSKLSLKTEEDYGLKEFKTIRLSGSLLDIEMAESYIKSKHDFQLLRI
jgi:hypothetical protein